jgi:hypothetical protein
MNVEEDLMKFKFTEKKITEIEKVLGAKFSKRTNQYRMLLENEDLSRKLTLEIFLGIKMGTKQGVMVNVYTPSAHAQLHFCSGFVASDVLGEVTFIGENSGRISGIIVEKDAAYSVYSNVDASLLSGDFTELGPEVMLSGIALSLAEHLLDTK